MAILAAKQKETSAAVKEMEALLKKIKKTTKRRRNTGKQVTNLMHPVNMSDELCEFLELDHGSAMSRGKITSLLNDYAKKNEMKKEGNGRIIVVDDKLGKLLGMDAKQEVQVIQLQTFLKNKSHFSPAAQTVVA